MSRSRAVLLAALVGSCGPSAASYEVDLTLETRCITRAGVESCDAPAGERMTSTLSIEPRGDAVLLQLGDQLFVTGATSAELAATRTVETRHDDSGCQSRSVHQLSLQQGWGEVSGGYSEQETTEGPSGACGQTPYGERRSYQLTGTEITDL
ncbi:MAG: hypothetical protein JXR83_18655 [Deltaproteobacteria bacterium]|nr:hypothetical protein [Deltaproteobacteria bacterium]